MTIPSHGKTKDTGHFEKCIECKKIGTKECENNHECKCFESIKDNE